VTASKRDSRIAILSPIFSNPASHGGLTPVVRNLAWSMARRGISVDLLVRLPKGQRQVPVELPARISVRDLGTRHRWTTALAVAHYLRSEKPTALLAVGHGLNLAAVWGKRLAPGSRVVLSVHNTMSREAAAKGRYRQRKRLRAISRYYPLADGIVAVSRGVSDDLVEHTSVGRDQVKVIYNPIVTPEVLAQANEPADHPWLNEGDVPVVLGVGRLEPQKAFDKLLQAFAQLKPRRACRLIIIGEGPDRRKLEELAVALGIAEDVSMPGFQRNPHAFMKKANVFVLSSDFEGFGNVLVEALAAGTPVVATDCPSGPREILDDGRFGRLVPVGDIDALAAAIGESLDEPPDEALLAKAITRFDAATVAAQYLSYLGIPV